jgi:hypothetical protein
MIVKVVDLKRRTPDTEVETIARFVLGGDESIRIVSLLPNGTSLAEQLVAKGIPGPDDRMLQLTDGLEFLTYLCEAFRGSRLWATPVFEIAVDDTLDSSA